MANGTGGARLVQEALHQLVIERQLRLQYFDSDAAPY
jgi:hypothetical protein